MSDVGTKIHQNSAMTCTVFTDLPFDIVIEILQKYVYSIPEINVKDFGSRSRWMLGFEYNDSLALVRAIQLPEKVCEYWKECIRIIMQGNRKVLLLTHLMVHTKFYFDLLEKPDGSIFLGLEPNSEKVCLQQMVDIFTLPADLAPHELEICCTCCGTWLPQLISRLLELKDQGRRISSTLKSLKLEDCGSDHEWECNNRWKNCNSSLIELNELVGSMSGEICSLIHPVIIKSEGKVDVDFYCFYHESESESDASHDSDASDASDASDF